MKFDRKDGGGGKRGRREREREREKKGKIKLKISIHYKTNVDLRLQTGKREKKEQRRFLRNQKIETLKEKWSKKIVLKYFFKKRG